MKFKISFNKVEVAIVLIHFLIYTYIYINIYRSGDPFRISNAIHYSKGSVSYKYSFTENIVKFLEPPKIFFPYKEIPKWLTFYEILIKFCLFKS